MRILTTVAVALTLAASLGTAHAGKNSSSITKCKDENGKWHYGDFAASECARSRVTTLNEQGVKVDETEAALSREELRARREAKARADIIKAEKLAAHARDRRLLMTYESVARLEEARDERLASVDGFIRVDEEFLKRLQDQYVGLEARRVSDPNNRKLLSEIATTEEQISAYEESLASRMSDRKGIEDQFQGDIDRYKEIKKNLTEEETSLGLN